MKSIIRQTEEFARWHKKLDAQARAVQEHRP